jgi:hypothetical protein
MDETVVPCACTVLKNALVLEVTVLTDKFIARASDFTTLLVGLDCAVNERKVATTRLTKALAAIDVKIFLLLALIIVEAVEAWAVNVLKSAIERE